MTDQKMLAEYDRAAAVLARALNSTRIEEIVGGYDELDHVKLYARKVCDRTLLADAFEFQMRVERHLGEVLRTAIAAGQLRSRGQRGAAKKAALDGPARLPEIGVDYKLSAKAKAMAGMDQGSFDVVISDVRDWIASGRAPGASIGNAMRRVKAPGAAPTSVENDNSVGFKLSDGTPIGQVKIGKLRSRIDRLSAELEILTAINERVGSNADALATVADSISKAALAQIITAATTE